MRPKILIVDEDGGATTTMKRVLKGHYEVDVCPSAANVLQVVRDNVIDVAMIDANVTGGGLQLLELIRRSRPDVPVVMTSATPDPELVVAAMKAGASDFFIKPLEDGGAVAARLNSTVSMAKARRGVHDLMAQIENDSRPLPRYTDARQLLMSEFQRRYLERLMRDAKGNLSAASRLSGIDRANLRRALQKHNQARNG